MSTNDKATEHQDPRVELLQAVYDRINPWEETATPEQIRVELDQAIDKAGVEVSDETRDAIVAHIERGSGREDVADLL